MSYATKSVALKSWVDEPHSAANSVGKGSTCDDLTQLQKSKLYSISGIRRDDITGSGSVGTTIATSSNAYSATLRRSFRKVHETIKVAEFMIMFLWGDQLVRLQVQRMVALLSKKHFHPVRV